MSDVVKAGAARCFELEQGQSLRIVNTFGTQVVDVWAICQDDPAEVMSMEHSRVHSSHTAPKLSTVFCSNRRRSVLTIVKDKSPGIHDWLLAACDRYRYQLLGCDDHANCSDNLNHALLEVGISLGYIPSPLNLFESVGPANVIQAPQGRPGDFVELKALLPIYLVCSACPQDMVPTNGVDMIPRDISVNILPKGSQ